MLRSKPDPGFRRYLALSWAKTRARRERLLKPESRVSEDDVNETLMENVRRTNVLVPPASTLVGMWLLDWNVASEFFFHASICACTDTLSVDRTLLLSTSVPFEAADAEDRSIVGVGEILTRLMNDLMMWNMNHPEAQTLPVSYLIFSIINSMTNLFDSLNIYSLPHDHSPSLVLHD